MGIDQRTLRTKYMLVPGSVTVTYKVQNAGAGVPVAGARQRPIESSERSSAAFRGSVVDCNWILPADTLGGIVPKPGDAVVDPSAAAWLIERVESALLESDYKCYAVKQR